MEIIAKMEDNGFKIHGVSFDCGNKTLIKECGVQLSGEDQKFWFPNPRDSTRKVYLFPGNYTEFKISNKMFSFEFKTLLKHEYWPFEH